MVEGGRATRVQVSRQRPGLMGDVHVGMFRLFRWLYLILAQTSAVCCHLHSNCSLRLNSPHPSTGSRLHVCGGSGRGGGLECGPGRRHAAGGQPGGACVPYYRGMCL